MSFDQPNKRTSHEVGIHCYEAAEHDHCSLSSELLAYHQADKLCPVIRKRRTDPRHWRL